MTGETPPSGPSRGVIYIAIGERFVGEAAISARSVRRHMPDLPITLFTDVATAQSGPFDAVIHIQREGGKVHREKLVWMRQTPYDQTLFLDTDTYLADAVDDMFDLLDRFDMAMTHDRAYQDHFPAGAGVPSSFREFNTGVVAFRNTEAVRALFAEAVRWHDRLGDESVHDQPGFRIAAYHSDVRIAPLTYEYNCRFSNINMVSGPVKILHCRPAWGEHSEKSLEAIAAKVNVSPLPRAYVAGQLFILEKNRPGFFRPRYKIARAGSLFEAKPRYLARRFGELLRTQGIGAVMRMFAARLKGRTPT